MDLTPYHAKYFAHELTKRYPSDSVEKLAGAVASAQVDLNPHQVEAALFAFRSPGIYALYDGDELYYVGKSGELRKRVRHHLRDRQFGERLMDYKE
jgi:hypothetical protein